MQRPANNFKRNLYLSWFLYRALGFQVAQWQRICVPIQEPQEMQVPSLGWQSFLGGRNGNPFQYFCLGDPIDRGACWTIVHGVMKSWT